MSKSQKDIITHNKAKFSNLHLTKLTKFKSGNYSKYIGYCADEVTIVYVCYYKDKHGKFIGIGKGETEYEAEQLEAMSIKTNKELNDKTILKILENYYKWKIEDFFDLCD